MKNKYLVLTLCFLMIFVLSGCNDKVNKIDVGDVSQIEIDNSIYLSLKDNSLDKTGAIVIINNNFDTEIFYTDLYYLEVYKDNEWHSINYLYAYNEPLKKVDAKSKIEWNINWESSYGKLSKGKYRIVIPYGYDYHENFSHYMGVEFDIK